MNSPLVVDSMENVTFAVRISAAVTAATRPLSMPSGGVAAQKSARSSVRYAMSRDSS